MDIKPQPSRRPQSFFTPRRQTFSPHNPAHQNTTVIRPGANSNNAASDPMPAAATPHAGMAAAPQVGSARQPFTEPELPPVSASSMHAQKAKKKKRLIILGIIAAVVVLGGSGGCFALLRTYHPRVTPAVLPNHKYTPPQPTTVASTLTGLPVDPSVNKRQVTAVMIENSLDARPQSGLDQAGIVFEALAEGGVTRFMALFQDTQPDYI